MGLGGLGEGRENFFHKKIERKRVKVIVLKAHLYFYLNKYKNKYMEYV